MKHENYCDKANIWALSGDYDVQEHFVWSTNEESRLRSLSLYLIRSIVEKHGGSVEVDLATDTISIDVPEKEQMACAKEIEEQVGDMCC